MSRLWVSQQRPERRHSASPERKGLLLKTLLGQTVIPFFAKKGWLRHKEKWPVPYSAQTGSCFKLPLIQTVRDA